MQIVEITEAGFPTLEHDDQIAVGIDFGTTNSLIAISYLQKPRIIKSVEKQELIPSAIAFEDDHFIIGKNIGIHSIKRLLGKTLNEVLENPVLFAIVKDFINHDSKILKLNFANQVMSLPEIVAQLFLYLKFQAEQDLETHVTKVVITVPAHFNDAARGEVMLAAKIAGLDILRLVAEPTAAAYAYKLNKRQEGCYLVYDLGGGTFDISILKMQEGIIQVIATSGDNMLGGDDIDHLLAEYVTAHHTANDSLTPAQVLIIAKSAKELLSYQEEYNNSGISLNKDQVEQSITPLVQRTVDIAHEALKQADHPDIDGIILVGGATRIPLVSTMLKQSFNTHILADIDPDKAVALGAALQAENLTHPHGTALLIDVVPLSVGMELYDGIVEKIILRNSPLPISITKEFTTYADNQTAIKFHILQGEREMAGDSRSLAKFELKNLPLMKAGGARVEVTFSMDADGILSVSALEKITGQSHIVEVNPTYGLHKTAIDKILENAYKHAHSDHVSRLLQEAIIAAKTLIYNVENAIEEMPDLLPADEMDEIRHAISNLKKIIGTGDRNLIIKHCRKFETMIKKFTIKRADLAVAQLLTGKHISQIK